MAFNNPNYSYFSEITYKDLKTFFKRRLVDVSESEFIEL